MAVLWIDVLGFEGHYQVSNSGSVRSIKNGVVRLLKPYVNKKGYRIVNLSKNGVATTFNVARLVALAFLPNPDNLPCVDHIVPARLGGGDNVENLRWVTCKQNINNPLTLKYKSEIRKNNFHHTEESKRKLSESHTGLSAHWRWVKVVCEFPDGTKRIFESIQKVADELGLKRHNIVNNLMHYTKQHKGFKFSYLTDVS